MMRQGNVAACEMAIRGVSYSGWTGASWKGSLGKMTRDSADGRESVFRPRDATPLIQLHNPIPPAKVVMLLERVVRGEEEPQICAHLFRRLFLLFSPPIGRSGLAAVGSILGSFHL